MGIKVIAYGTEDSKNWFVQTSCDTEHYGQDCECKSYGEKFTEQEAVKMAEDLGEVYKVPVERW